MYIHTDCSSNPVAVIVSVSHSTLCSTRARLDHITGSSAQQPRLPISSRETNPPRTHTKNYHRLRRPGGIHVLVWPATVQGESAYVPPEGEAECELAGVCHLAMRRSCERLRYRYWCLSDRTSHLECDVRRGEDLTDARWQSFWWFMPAPMLAGLSEVLAFVTVVELAYTMAPRTSWRPFTFHPLVAARMYCLLTMPASLRSISQALLLSIQAISSLVVLILNPIMRDPLLVYPFASTVSIPSCLAQTEGCRV